MKRRLGPLAALAMLTLIGAGCSGTGSSEQRRRRSGNGGRLAGAGLDVLELEPPEQNNPLLQLENAVLTPHAAGNDTESRDAMALSAARSIVALSRGEWPTEAIVNSEVRARFQW